MRLRQAVSPNFNKEVSMRTITNVGLILAALCAGPAAAGINNVVTGSYPETPVRNTFGTATELYSTCLSRVTNKADVDNCSVQSTLSQEEKETVKNNFLIAYAQMVHPQSKKLDCSVYIAPKPGYMVDSEGYIYCMQRNEHAR